MSEIPYGYCQCGCGARTKIASRNRKALGHVKGQPLAYLVGHGPHGPGPREPLTAPNPGGMCQCGCGAPAPLATQTRYDRGTIKGEPVRYLPGHGSKFDPAETPDGPNPGGFCLCGCGEKTNLSTAHEPSRGYVRDKPMAYLPGHYSRTRTDPTQHPRWKGGRVKLASGYIRVFAPGHPRAHQPQGYVYEHILVAEKALGKYLPPKAQVHHVNGDPSDNRPTNLVICEDDAYHKLLHKRQRDRERRR